MIESKLTTAKTINNINKIKEIYNKKGIELTTKVININDEEFINNLRITHECTLTHRTRLN